ncbi:hypothetical protein [Halopiger goleimassiliensis]|uniref:hypothetical protein n=1 Tax=Halopiger goleimassiliensis TaxID=1293048 RepID=UPI0006779B8D|nr:hypothetical protein [Halopiger goleimassiliensis]
MVATIHQIDALCTVRVPLGASGSLAEGAVGVLERADAVETVTSVDVRGVSPALNETTVDLEVRLEIAADAADEPTSRRTLERAVGVRAVERVETVEPDAPPVAEVG